jgi:replicative DNA helicase
LKFIGHLGKFDNLDDFDTPFGEFHSKMNAAANDNTFTPDNFPSASDAFGAPEEDDNDVPF